MANIFTKILGNANEKAIKRINPIIPKINSYFEQYSKLKIDEISKFQTELRDVISIKKDWDTAHKLIDSMNALAKERGAISDEELKGKTQEFKTRIKEKVGNTTGKEREKLEQEALNEILPEAFAVVKETCRRLLGKSWEITGHEQKWDMIPFDVQLIGAIVLHQGKITEMATGEGKTLVATMPLYLNALLEEGCHLITVNDYLAKRDTEWMGGIYDFLSISVGCIQDGMEYEERIPQYNCDITYGTNSQFGFDYLRDNMKWKKEEKVQRGHYYSIVDEVDSVLIDEARTPLIISGAVERVINREYAKLNPIVENTVNRQTLLVNKIVADAERLLNEAEKLSEEGKNKETEEKRKEAGKKLLQAQKGTPKNRRLMKLKKEAGITKLIEDTEKELLSAEFSQKTSLKKEETELHKLQEELYYTIDEKGHAVNYTEIGRDALSHGNPDFFTLPDLSQELPKIDNDSTLSPREKFVQKQAIEREYAESSGKLHAINQLLRAYSLFKKDVEYVVQNKKVMIVDEFTGRLMPGRRYSDGLHQALEAKERVEVESETQTLATITIQNYFRMYSKLAGMTGTAETEAGEFWDIYKLEVLVIPTNKPVRRIEYDDSIYKTRREKYDAITKEIEEVHTNGRPILVGTVSVDASETLARMLKRKGIPHQVLNAKHHKQEAEIITLAGQSGKVTIATNMAGRGTDIKLGKGVINIEYFECEEKDGMEKCFEEFPCGLHIIGTERHESRRIDRQLRGRCARQGDPGSTKFYLSLEDNLMRLFGSDRIANAMSRWGPSDGEPIQHKLVTRAIEGAQKRVERFNFDIRKHLLEYDDVINRQRETIYTMRDEILEGEDLADKVQGMIEDVLYRIINTYTSKSYSENWDWEGLNFDIRDIFMFDFRISSEDKNNIKREELKEKLEALIFDFYKTRKEQIGPEIMEDLEHQVFLHVIDKNWKDHLYELDALKEGIGLRGYAQRDPLVEYKREAYGYFEKLLDCIAREVVRNLFGLRFRTEEEKIREATISKEKAYKPDAATATLAPARATASVGTPTDGKPSPMGMGRPYAAPQQRPVIDTYKRKDQKVNRNALCPCGSGKKYKNCCGRVS